MCKETPEELVALAAAEQARHIAALNAKSTKEFDKWWHGKIWGWFDAAEGDVARTRRLLELPPCECGADAENA